VFTVETFDVTAMKKACAAQRTAAFQCGANSFSTGAADYDGSQATVADRPGAVTQSSTLVRRTMVALSFVNEMIP
jgi:hypothetical protein